jgi:hypothetical protein
MSVRNLPHHLAALCIALWVGGMWMTGYGVVPVLFKMLPDRQLAGMVAGQLFTLLAYIGIACALYLLAFQLQQFGRSALRLASFRIALQLLVLAGTILQPSWRANCRPCRWTMNSIYAAQFKTLHASPASCSGSRACWHALVIVSETNNAPIAPGHIDRLAPN